ncbi:MAG TPA: hypothetical protein VFX70_22900, partial [Mycobacteriales bacterium]|nr:hypothetical protein [Mycobacteriales bacterium]
FPTVPLLAAAGILGLVLLAERAASVRWPRLAPLAGPTLAGPTLGGPAAAGADPLGLEATRPDLRVTDAPVPDDPPPARADQNDPPDRVDGGDSRPD